MMMRLSIWTHHSCKQGSNIYHTINNLHVYQQRLSLSSLSTIVNRLINESNNKKEGLSKHAISSSLDINNKSYYITKSATLSRHKAMSIARLSTTSSSNGNSNIDSMKENNKNNNSNQSKQNNTKQNASTYALMAAILASLGYGSMQMFKKKNNNLSRQESEESSSSTKHPLSTRKANSDNIIVTRDEGSAYTVGEKVSPEELRRRFEFHKTGDASNKIAVIGRGAYGRVVSATEKSTGRNVAIKVVPKGAMSAEGLLREVSVLRRVRGHDNIIHLLDVLECGGEWYVVTELCEGGELLDRIIDNGPYKEPEAKLVLRNLASAIEHIHECGFVHLDIKPENVVFLNVPCNGTNDVQCQDDDCRIIDFGMALEISGINRKGGLIVAYGPKDNRVRIGTMAYWSPEQVEALLQIKDIDNLAPNSANVTASSEGNENKTESTAATQKDDNDDLSKPRVGNIAPPMKSDPRACDIWALGVILYIMLYGAHPFDTQGKGDEMQIGENALNGKVNLELHHNKLKISEDAKDLLRKMLEKDPKKRIKINEVLHHPWVLSREHDKSQTKSRLPQSWTKAGYSPPNREKDEAIVSSDRVKPFKTERAIRAFYRALLIAAMKNASEQNKLYFDAKVAENEGKESNQSVEKEKAIAEAVAAAIQSQSVAGSSRLLADAFDILDTSKRGKIGFEEIENLYAAVEEDASSDGNPTSNSTQSLVLQSSSTHEGPQITKEEFEALLRTHDCVPRRLNAGEAVFCQGAVPQGMYILTEGIARVEWLPDMKNDSQSTNSNNANGNENQTTGIVVHDLAKMRPGTIFGETALLQGRRSRAATIRCVTPCEVLFIPKDDFLHAMAGSHILHKQMFAVVTEQQSRRVHELVEYYKPESYRVAKFKPGEVLFNQDDPATELFLIRKGVVEISVHAPASRDANETAKIGVRVGQRGAGDIVGLSSLTGGARHTTAKALIPVEAVVISETDAKKLWKEAPMFRFYLQPQIQGRNEAWQEAVADVERGISEPQLLPILGNGAPGLNEHHNAYTSFVKAMSQMKRRSYKLGDTIIQKGKSEKKEFYIVESGYLNVEISAPMPDEKEKTATEVLTTPSNIKNPSGTIILAQLGPGDHIGEQAILEHTPEDVIAVKAASDAEIFVLDEAKFLELLGDGNTPLAAAVRRASKQREHRWGRNIVNLAMRHADLTTPSNAPRGGWTRVKSGVEEKGGVYRMTLQKGEYLFEEGEYVDALYFIHRGELELKSSSDPDDDDFDYSRNNIWRSTIGPGETLGWEVFNTTKVKQEKSAVATADRTVVSKVPLRLLNELAHNYKYVNPKLEKRVRKNVVKLPQIQRQRSTYFGNSENISAKIRQEGVKVGSDS